MALSTAAGGKRGVPGPAAQREQDWLKLSPPFGQPGNYGFTDGNTASDGIGIPGGVGGGSGYAGHAIFYVGVPDVEAALQKAERLGGKRLLGPEQNPGTNLAVGHFADPEGHLIGLASTA